MLILAFTCSPPRFSVNALAKGHTVDSECMRNFFMATRHRFDNLRKNPEKFGDMLMQMDNARPHTSALTPGRIWSHPHCTESIQSRS